MRLDSVPTTKVLLIWTTLVIAFTLVGVFTGDLRALILKAVDNIETPSGKFSRGELANIFLIMGFIGTAVTLIVAVVLALFSDKGKRWAKWLFIILSVWHAVSAITGPIKITKMYPDISSISLWITSIISFIGWAYMAAHAYRFKRERFSR